MRTISRFVMCALLTAAAVPACLAASNGNTRNRTEALRDYRAILVKQISLSDEQSKHAEREVALGALTAGDLAELRARHLKLAADLKALDGGLLPRQSAPAARGVAEKRAREEYRQVVRTQIDFATQEFAAEQKRFELGASSTAQVIEKRRQLLNLELDLAAYDAGLVARAR
ncbi:MAG: hypothetical protein U0Q16_07700 [Bryobacteraceae bacterium]